MTPLRILVTGSRRFVNRKVIGDALTVAWKDLAAGSGGLPPLVVVHGAARGADSIAGEWAAAMAGLGLPVSAEPHPAEWERFGRSAGHRRNADMVRAGADLALAFPAPHGESRGTRNCVAQCERAGIRVVVHEGEAS